MPTSASRQLPIALAVLAALAGPATAWAADAPGPSKDQRALLRLAYPATLLPAYVPTGFELERVVVTAEGGGVGGGFSSVVVYLNRATDAAFGIETVSGGIGDLPYNPVTTIKGRGLPGGSCGLYFEDFGPGKQRTYLTSWLVPGANGPCHRLVGAGYLRDTLVADMTGPIVELSRDEVKRVVASIAPYKP